MPLFYTHNINENTRLAVWHITEEEDFFRKIDIPHNIISHPHKRLQHLAGRYLLKVLDPDFPANEICLQGGRPYLPNGAWHFSISHCADYAAVIMSREWPVGIDVEVTTDKLRLLQNKFLSKQEQEIVQHNGNSIPHLQKLAACWSAKECMFKWYAKGNVDFRKDMIIQALNADADGGTIDARFGKEVGKMMHIPFKFFDSLCLAWTI